MTAQRFDDEIEYTNGADPTRKARFDFQQVRSGAKRTYSFPDRNLDLTGVADIRRSGYWSGAFGNTNPQVINAPFAAPTGTPVAISSVTTSGPGQTMSRNRYPTTAGAGTLGGIRANVAWLIPDAARSVGYELRYMCMRADPAPVAGVRAFWGLQASTGAPSNVEPDTLTNVIGMGQLSSDSQQLYLIAAGAVAQPAISMGPDFQAFLAAADGVNGIPYEIDITVDPDNTQTVTVVRNDTGAVFATVLSGAQKPLSSVAMGCGHWVTNNATALEARIDFMAMLWNRVRL